VFLTVLSTPPDATIFYSLFSPTNAAVQVSVFLPRLKKLSATYFNPIPDFCVQRCQPLPGYVFSADWCRCRVLCNIFLYCQRPTGKVSWVFFAFSIVHQPIPCAI